MRCLRDLFGTIVHKSLSQQTRGSGSILFSIATIRSAGVARKRALTPRDTIQCWRSQNLYPTPLRPRQLFTAAFAVRYKMGGVIARDSRRGLCSQKSESAPGSPVSSREPPHTPEVISGRYIKVHSRGVFTGAIPHNFIGTIKLFVYRKI